MADKHINELEEAKQFRDDSLLAAWHESGTKKVPGSKIKEYVRGTLDEYVHGAGFLLDLGQTHTGEPGSEAKVENTGTAEKPVLEFTLPRGEKGDTGEVTRKELDDALMRKSGRNFLINSCFISPVNQRGQTTYSGNGNTVDMWKTWSSAGDQKITVDKENGHLRIQTGSVTANFLILLEKEDAPKEGDTVTGSVLLSSGALETLTGQLKAPGAGAVVKDTSAWSGDIQISLNTDGNRMFLIDVRANQTVDIVAMKLELGDAQTLAHMEGGKWVLNEIPCYSEELARCQRYYFKSDITYTTSFIHQSRLGCSVDFPVRMRTRPNVTIYSYNGTPGVLSNFHSGADDTSVIVNGVVDQYSGADGFSALAVTNASADTPYVFKMIADASL